MQTKAVNADSGKDFDLRQGLGLLFAHRMLNEPGGGVVDRHNIVDAVFENDLTHLSFVPNAFAPISLSPEPN